MSGYSENNFAIKTMPKPKPEKGGRFKAAIIAIIAILCVGGAVFWLGKPDKAKEELRNKTAEIINDTVKETPLAGIGEIFRKAPPPPPDYVLAPQTVPGTLAGRTVTGSLPQNKTGEDTSVSEKTESGSQFFSDNRQILNGSDNMADMQNIKTGQNNNNGINADTVQQTYNEANRTQNPKTAAENNTQTIYEKWQPVTEDKEVTPAYINQLAKWLVVRYRPASGKIEATAQSINLFGAVTLANQARGGRTALLRYTFQPSMLKGLYNLYFPQFMADISDALKRRSFNKKQERQFYLALAGKTALWASGLAGVLNVKNLKGQLDKIDSFAQKTVEVNMQLATAVFELDGLREKNASAAALDAAQKKIDRLTALYRKSVKEHEQAQKAFAVDLRKNAGQNLDEDTLLFIAAWAERRMAYDKDGRAALETCAELLRELSRSCAQSGL